MAGSQGIRAGRAYVELGVGDKLTAGLKKAQRRLRAFGAGVQRVGARIAAMGAAMAAPLLASAKVFAGFDDQMRAVQGVLGATGEDFDKLTAKAKVLGRTTSYTASEVAGAMLELARAGFDTKQIDSATGAMLALARATGTDLAEATAIAGNTLRAFSMDASQMGRTSDVMAATANNSAQTLSDLGEAMKYTAPVADEFGLSLEQTAKSLGYLANFGIKGSMAGTTMKNIMLQLADPSIRKKLEQLGVSVTNAAGEFEGVDTILGGLGTALQGLPAPKRLEIMKDLFGKRAVTGGIKLTAASFEKLNHAIDNAAGTAKRTADVMDSGIGGAMRRMWSMAEGAAIAIGESLAPVLSQMGAAITAIGGRITEWIERNREVVVTVLQITAVVLATGAAMILLGGIIKLAAASLGVLVGITKLAILAFKVFGVVMGLFFSPVALIIAAVGALGAYIITATEAGAKALGWLGEKFGGLKDDAVQAYEAIGDALAAGDIGTAAKVMWLTLKKWWNTGINWLKGLWLNFKHAFWSIGLDAFSGLLLIGAKIWNGLERAWAHTAWFFTNIWNSFVGFFGKTWQKMVGWAKKAWAWIKSLFSDSDEEAKAAVMAEIDRETRAAVNRIENETKRKNAAAEAKRRARLRSYEAEYSGDANRILQQNTRLQNQRKKSYQADEMKIGMSLLRAQKEWKDGMDEAAEKSRKRREEKDDGPGKLEGPAKLLEDVKNAVSGLKTGLGETAAQISVSGSFGSRALGLMAGGTAVDRIALATEQTARNTKPIKRMKSPVFE